MPLNANEPDFAQRITNYAYEIADAQLPEPLRSLAGLAAGPVMAGAELTDAIIARLDTINRTSPLGRILAATLDSVRDSLDAIDQVFEDEEDDRYPL